MILKLLFYFFSAVLLISALKVISSKGAVQSVLYLVLAFVSSSALWMLIQAEFLSLLLIVVYVGAVMVLFLFVVMMLDVDKVKLHEGFVKHLPLGIIVGLIMAIEMIFVLTHKQGFFIGLDATLIDVVKNNASVKGNTHELGMLLYTKYLYPFGVAAAILLVAMIAAIGLTHRKPRAGNRTMPIEQQLQATKESSLRIVQMEVETLASWNNTEPQDEEASMSDSETSTVKGEKE